MSLSEHPTLRHCVQRLIYDNRWGNFTSLLRGRYGKDYGILDWRGNTIARKKDLQASGLLDQLSREALTKDSIDVEIAYPVPIALHVAFTVRFVVPGTGCVAPTKQHAYS